MGPARFGSFDVEVDLAPTAAKRLLLARVASDGRVQMLRAGLTRPHHQLLCAAAVGVHVDQNAETGALKFVETEIGGFDRRLFLGRDVDAGLAKHGAGLVLPTAQFLFRDHGGVGFRIEARAWPRRCAARRVGRRSREWARKAPAHPGRPRAGQAPGGIRRSVP